MVNHLTVLQLYLMYCFRDDGWLHLFLHAIPAGFLAWLASAAQ